MTTAEQSDLLRGRDGLPRGRSGFSPVQQDSNDPACQTPADFPEWRLEFEGYEVVFYVACSRCHAELRLATPAFWMSWNKFVFWVTRFDALCGECWKQKEDAHARSSGPGEVAVSG